MGLLYKLYVVRNNETEKFYDYSIIRKTGTTYIFTENIRLAKKFSILENAKGICNENEDCEIFEINNEGDLIELESEVE